MKIRASIAFVLSISAAFAGPGPSGKSDSSANISRKSDPDSSAVILERSEHMKSLGDTKDFAGKAKYFPANHSGATTYSDATHPEDEHPKLDDDAKTEEEDAHTIPPKDSLKKDEGGKADKMKTRKPKN